MTVIAMVIQLSTRGTVDSDNWFFAAVRQGIAAKLPSAGLWLNASKSESMPESDDFYSPVFVLEYE